MLVDVEELYKAGIERRAALERSMFEHPPVDWPEFQKRLGQWSELTMQIQDIEKLAKGQE